MACEPIKGDTFEHGIICSAQPSKLRCRTIGCDKWGEYLCDYEVESGLTCDNPVCEDHRTSVGPDRDHCSVHRDSPDQAAAELGRKAGAPSSSGSAGRSGDG